MGAGIAQVSAQVGCRVALFDVSLELAQKGCDKIGRFLQKGVDKGKVTPEERDATLARVRPYEQVAAAVEGCTLVVEAAPEDLELKRRIFAELAECARSDAILATNTSSLPISRIAAGHPAAARVVGMHFFNPVHIMKLVEVVRARQTSPEAATCALELARRMGKEPIDVQDSPGFASSRLGLVIGLEAMRMFEAGVASVEDIDKAMTLGYGFPMGPLKLTDLVGLDVRLAIAEHLTREIGPGFEPPQVLRDKVAAGELGKKSGRGFYDWS